MPNPCYPAPIWLVWRELPILEKLPFLILCMISLYSFFLAATVVRLWHTAPRSDQFHGVHRRISNLQRATTATFYLLGFGIFAGLQFAYCIIDNSRVPIGWIVVRNLQVHFAFAGNAFLMLLIVNVFQWFIASQVNALQRQANS
jgi:hypothetical protein